MVKDPVIVRPEPNTCGIKSGRIRPFIECSLIRMQRNRWLAMSGSEAGSATRVVLAQCFVQLVDFAKCAKVALEVIDERARCECVGAISTYACMEMDVMINRGFMTRIVSKVGFLSLVLTKQP